MAAWNEKKDLAKSGTIANQAVVTICWSPGCPGLCRMCPGKVDMDLDVLAGCNFLFLGLTYHADAILACDCFLHTKRLEKLA